MRNVPAELDPAVVTLIDERLDAVQVEHRVRIGWAVESGSRAWGFPSPDSDYDCRFIYLHDARAYLTPWPPRDVVETPLDAVLDVNGWDLRKALDLMVRGNATVLEWLRSPIVYRGDPAFRQRLLDLADRTLEPELVARHYLHLGRRQWEQLDAEAPDTPVRLKGMLYALRPAAVLAWLQAHPDRGVPPMRLQDLLAGTGPATDLVEAVDALLARKAAGRELGRGPMPTAIRGFVLGQLDRTDLEGSGARRLSLDAARDLATETFQDLVLQGAAAAG